MNLKPATLSKIDGVIPHYPAEQKRSATLPPLHLIQEDLGYIPDPAIERVAAKLGIQPINVYEVVTFYPMSRRQPDRPAPHQGLPHAVVRADGQLQDMRDVRAGVQHARRPGTEVSRPMAK